ncbi:hypothetical protein BDV06DRAFT_224584 [Aspergillus oleicola]
MRYTAAVLAVFASLMAYVSAEPAEKRQIDSVSITFYNAQDDSWHQTFPTDLSSVEIDNPMTVTHIYNPGGAICGFSGTDGGSWTIHIGDHELNNPQSLRSGFCSGL